MTTVGKVVRRGWALFALPTVLCFAVFFVVPLAMGIYLSFTSFRTVTDAKWVGLKNYVDALSDPEFGAALWDRSLTTSAVYGFWGMVILLCWQQIGYMMVIYIAGFQSLPTDLIEAAQVDGASNGQIMRRIIIPLMMPSVTVCSFLTVANGFKMFDQNLALTNGAPSNASEMIAFNIYRTMYGRTGFEGVAQAKAVIFFIIVAVVAFIQNRITTSKEVEA